MNNRPTVIVAGQVLTATADPYATAGTGEVLTVKSASVCNTTAGVVALTVYRVPSGGSATAGNTLISARNIAVGETYNCPELINKALEAGDKLYAKGLGLSFDVTAARSTVN
jgi:hypothetical protein